MLIYKEPNQFIVVKEHTNVFTSSSAKKVVPIDDFKAEISIPTTFFQEIFQSYNIYFYCTFMKNITINRLSSLGF